MKILPRCTLSLQQVEQFHVEPISYPNARLDGDDRLFVWDGEKVHLNKTIFFENTPHLQNNLGMMGEHCEKIRDIVNFEQVVKCPHCHLYDHVSSIAQGVEHPRTQCHDGHFREFLKTYFPKVYYDTMSNDEYKVIHELYCKQDKTMKVYPKFTRVGCELQNYSDYLRKDLGI